MLDLRTEEQKAKHLLNAKLMLWKALNSLQPAFNKDLHNLEVLNAVAHWLAKLEHPHVKTGQGVMLTGPVGTGKTLMMSAVDRCFGLAGLKGFPVVNAIRIVKEYNRADGGKDSSKMGGDHVILNYANMPRLTIDDAVKESDGKHYGNVANVIEEIISLRYDKWRRGECLTNLTSNGGPADLIRRYDERCVSRCVEMMGEFRLGGPDRRVEAAPPVQMPVFPDLFAIEEAKPEPTPEEMDQGREQLTKAKEEFAALIRLLKESTEPNYQQ